MFGNASLLLVFVVADSAIMVSSWPVLHGGRSTVVVVLINRRWLKYIYFIAQ